MRIQFVSDLHLETRPKETFERLIKPKAPCLALLGDIAPLGHPNLRPFLEWCSERWETILYVPGVLELIEERHTIDEQLYRLKGLVAPYLNIHILYREAFVSSDGFLVLGCTFWSCMVSQSKSIQRLHQEDTQWILSKVKSYTNPCLVLSHYGPVGWVQQEIPTDPKTASVFPQLELLLRRPIVAWMFGHLHDTIEYSKVWSNADGTPQSILLVSNGLGYAPKNIKRLPEEFRDDAVLGLDSSVF